MKSEQVVVLKVDPNEEKISLGMKQTEQDPWMVLPYKYPVGTRIQGKVRNLTSFGAFVEIEPGIDGPIHTGLIVDIGNNIEGFVPLSHLSENAPADAGIEDLAYEGMKYDLRVVEVDPIHRRIILAVTGIPEDQPPRPETPSVVHKEDEEVPVEM